jgi:hypothetical protein
VAANEACVAVLRSEISIPTCVDDDSNAIHSMTAFYCLCIHQLSVLILFYLTSKNKHNKKT